jgi:hypothetical protein
MARKKVTVLVDQEKLKEAQELTKSRSLSATIDLALDRLVRQEVTRRDVELYLKYPQTEEEIAWGNVPPAWNHLDEDDVDYDAEYPDLEDDDKSDASGDEYVDYEALRRMGYDVDGGARR